MRKQAPSSPPPHIQPAAHGKLTQNTLLCCALLGLLWVTAIGLEFLDYSMSARSASEMSDAARILLFLKKEYAPLKPLWVALGWSVFCIVRIWRERTLTPQPTTPPAMESNSRHSFLRLGASVSLMIVLAVGFVFSAVLLMFLIQAFVPPGARWFST